MDKFIAKSRAFQGMALPVLAVAVQSFGLPGEVSQNVEAGTTALLTLAGVIRYLLHLFKPDGKQATFKVSGTFLLPFILAIGIGGSQVLIGCTTAPPGAAQDCTRYAQIVIDLTDQILSDTLDPDTYAMAIDSRSAIARAAVQLGCPQIFPE